MYHHVKGTCKAYRAFVFARESGFFVALLLPLPSSLLKLSISY